MDKSIMFWKPTITSPLPLCCWIQRKTTRIRRHQLKVVLPLRRLRTLNWKFNSKTTKIIIRKVCRSNSRSYQQRRQQQQQQQPHYSLHLTLKLQHLWLDWLKFLTLKLITDSNEQQITISLGSKRNVSKIIDAISKQRLLFEGSRRK